MSSLNLLSEGCFLSWAEPVFSQAESKSNLHRYYSLFCIIFAKAVSQTVIRQDSGERGRERLGCVCVCMCAEKKERETVLKATPGSKKNHEQTNRNRQREIGRERM